MQDGYDALHGQAWVPHIGKWEYYMVKPSLWAKAGGGDGYLCIGCLEKRIGRTLRPSDFTNAPINEPDAWDTPRLLERRLGQKFIKEIRALAELEPEIDAARRARPKRKNASRHR